MSYQDDSPTAPPNKAKRIWLTLFVIPIVGLLLALLGGALTVQWLFLLGLIVVMGGISAVIVRGDAARLRRRGYRDDDD